MRNKKIRETKALVFYAEMMIDFYNHIIETETDDKRKSDYEMKIQQIETSLGFNKQFIDFMEQ